MTIRLYARRKDIPLGPVSCDVSHDRCHTEDCEDCDKGQVRVDVFRRVIRLEGDLTPDHRAALLRHRRQVPGPQGFAWPGDHPDRSARRDECIMWTIRAIAATGAQPDQPAGRMRLNLALQGGGAHGAFTWGALDKVLEDGRLEIAASSITSAGAVNAGTLADGQTVGGPEGARQSWSISGGRSARLPGIRRSSAPPST